MKRDKVGDLLLATPLLSALRQALPRARIELLASDYNAWVVEGHPCIDRLWVYRRARTGRRVDPVAGIQQVRTWLALRRRRFDVAIAANGEDSPRATRRAVLAGARRTVAYGGTPRRGVTDLLAVPQVGHERDRLLGLLAPLGIVPVGPLPEPDWHPSAAAIDEARAWLGSRGLGAGAYVVIGLGARRAARQPSAGQVLRWSAAARSRGLATVFMWTPGAGDNPHYPGDDAAAQAVLEAGAAHVHPFRGPLQPAAALAWMARRSLFPDSGLMHLAAASPGGVVGLFADTGSAPPPSRWAPLGERSTWLEAPGTVQSLGDDAVLRALLG